MKKTPIQIGFILAILFSPIFSKAQITITPSATAAVLAAKLTGPGVLVLNPVLTCASNAEGTFFGPSTLSFDSGIVLTSGQALTTGTAVGAGGPASGFASTANGTPGDPSLDALSGVTTFDACVLEFDFRPAGDTIKFNYVFGSEEYTDYTCTSFNDVFGFFISGPGIGTARNIALVPGTTIPVCINSVNCGVGAGFGTLSTCTALGTGSPFCAYYVNNSTGTTITYDGLTTTLTAISAVTPCDTYHLKIGVADASDDILDSGVFLEAGSLTSVGISVNPLSSNPSDTTFGGAFCVRGCNPGQFIFNLTVPSATAQTLHFLIGGTAVNGYDYNSIPDSVVIPAGSTSASILVFGLNVPSTGPKTVIVYILGLYSCGGTPTIVDSAVITIYNSFTIGIITPDTSICLGKNVQINAFGNPFMHYQWTPPPTLSNDTLLMPIATPTITTTYTITGTYPGAGCPTVSAQFTITVTTLNIQVHDTMFCVGNTVPIHLQVIPFDPTYTFMWSPPAGLSSTTIQQPTFAGNTVGDFPLNVFVQNASGCQGIDSVTMHVRPLAIITPTPLTSTINFGGRVQLDAVNMTPYPLIYWWIPNDGSLNNPNINNPVASPVDSTTYVVYAMNEWGCLDSAKLSVNVLQGGEVVIPTAFTPNGDGLNDEFRILNLQFRKLVEFSVYNRWGQLIYQDNNPEKGWDGTFNGVLQDMDVYKYYVIISNPDGVNKVYKGDVTLIK